MGGSNIFQTSSGKIQRFLWVGRKRWKNIIVFMEKAGNMLFWVLVRRRGEATTSSNVFDFLFPVKIWGVVWALASTQKSQFASGGKDEWENRNGLHGNGSEFIVFIGPAISYFQSKFGVLSGHWFLQKTHDFLHRPQHKKLNNENNDFGHRPRVTNTRKNLLSKWVVSAKILNKPIVFNVCIVVSLHAPHRFPQRGPAIFLEDAWTM